MKFEALRHYSRPDIQDAMLDLAKNREVVGCLSDGSYLKRPDIISYPKDIIERVKRGVISFHYSVERWIQPMQLSPNLKQSELDSLRIGFDVLIDIDSKVKLEHALITARIVHNFLRDLGVNPTLKFSGRRGVHIGIAFEAFPKKIDMKPTSKRYPEIPQVISEFIRERIKDYLLDELISFEGGVSSLTEILPSVSQLSPYEFVEIEKNWGNRHLFRAPYSIHEKTGLVSLPLKVNELAHFSPEKARPEKVSSIRKFLINKEGEATELLLQALDWKAKQPKMIIKEVKEVRYKTKRPIPESFFPPCIKNILEGLSDGRKRSLFTLVTFLRNMNWKEGDIEKRIMEWNKKNSQPLRDRFVKTQLKWHFRQKRRLLPANCDSDLFYKSIGICQRDVNCGKNPINYPFKLMKKIKTSKGK
jgi:hypothetical protein